MPRRLYGFLVRQLFQRCYGLGFANFGVDGDGIDFGNFEMDGSDVPLGNGLLLLVGFALLWRKRKAMCDDI